VALSGLRFSLSVLINQAPCFEDCLVNAKDLLIAYGTIIGEEVYSGLNTMGNRGIIGDPQEEIAKLC
jgi:hypothetical protein